MSAAERTVVIDRPIEDVFAFFTDPDKDRMWRDQVKEMSVQGPMVVGSRVHHVIAGPGGRPIPADFEVTELEPPSRFAFRVVAGPVRPVGVYRFEPRGAATAVTFSLRAQLSGLKRLVMSRFVQRSMEGEMASLDKAKSMLESS